MGASELPLFLTPRQAAEVANLRIEYVYELTRRRALPMTKINRLIRIPRDEFLQWLRNDGNLIPASEFEE